MKRGTTILAGALALILTCGAPARAQEPTTDQEIVEATTMLFDKLALLADGLGMDAPELPRETFSSAFASALPVFPGDEPDLSWSSGFAFDFTTSHTTGGLEADEEGRTVLTDARGCLAADDIAEVVHFQRFARGGMRGHRCIIAFAGSEGDSAWVIQSRTFAEGPDRRLTAYYGVATAISGDAARARRVLEERLEQNVALAGLMADYALEMVLARAASSDPVTAESVDERLARLQARLEDITESFETLSPGPSPAPAPSAPDVSTPIGVQTVPVSDVDALVAWVDAALPALAESLGRPAPASVGPLFRPLFDAAGLESPDDPAASLVLGFNYAAEPEGSGGVLTDEAGCQSIRPGAAVVRFRRFELAGSPGHECVLSGPADGDEAGLWLLMSDVVVNGPVGRLDVKFGAVSASDADTPAARRMIELRLEEILMIATAISDAGVAIFLGEPVGQHSAAAMDGRQSPSVAFRADPL